MSDEVKKDEAPAIDDWRQTGGFLRTELRRHDLSHREMLIAELILEKTYGWQRDEIIFPQLRSFRDLTGIDEPDVSKILEKLCARKIVRIRRVKGQAVYSIRKDSDAWKALPRVSREDMRLTTNLMRELNGLEPITIEKESSLNFKNRSSAKKTSPILGDLPMGEPTGEPMCDQTGLFLELHLT